MNNPKNSGGFVAGTLIHTQTGLKPIEQIKVGDEALNSLHEPSLQTLFKFYFKNADGVLNKSVALDKKVDVLTDVTASTKTFFESVAFKELPVCFSSDTLVHTANGRWKIEYVKEGDLVLSRSEVTGEQDYRKVTKVFEHLRTQFYDVSFYVLDEKYIQYRLALDPSDDMDKILKSMSGHAETVTVTPKHPFWVRNKGWVHACDLKPGDELEVVESADYTFLDPSDPNLFFRERALSGQRHYAIVEDSVEYKTRSSRYVYNLEVEEFHTYFVGHAGAWVHDAIQQTS